MRHKIAVRGGWVALALSPQIPDCSSGTKSSWITHDRKTTPLAALYLRDCGREGAQGRRRLEHSRSIARRPRLYDRQRLAEPLRVSCWPRGHRGFPHAQMEPRT